MNTDTNYVEQRLHQLREEMETHKAEKKQLMDEVNRLTSVNAVLRHDMLNSVSHNAVQAMEGEIRRLITAGAEISQEIRTLTVTNRARGEKLEKQEETIKIQYHRICELRKEVEALKPKPESEQLQMAKRLFTAFFPHSVWRDTSVEARDKFMLLAAEALKPNENNLETTK